MIQASYEQLVERISRLSGLSVGEIKRKVEAKRAKLSGLISELGAAQVIAAELGISFDKQRFKIIDLLIGMKKIQVIGKILKTYPIRKYKKAEHEGEIGSFLFADDSSNIRAVLWDTKHIEMLKNNTIKEGSVLEIKNADVRGTTVRELHLSSRAEIELSDKQIKAVERPEVLPLKKISEVKSGERISIRGTIMQVFQPNFFSVCPECAMRVNYENDKAVCMKHGIVVPRKRALISIVIDDGSENMRATAFNESITRLFKISETDLEKLQDSSFLINKKQELLGTEMLFSGRVRRNVLFDRNEFVINETHEVKPDELIQELSK